MVKNLPAMQETQVQSLGWEDLLEKGMASHASILVWRILCHKEWGTTEQLTLHFFASVKNSPKYPLYFLIIFGEVIQLRQISTRICAKPCKKQKSGPGGILNHIALNSVIICQWLVESASVALCVLEPYIYSWPNWRLMKGHFFVDGLH